MHLDLPHLTTVYATLLSAICFIDEASLVHWSLSYQSTISTALKGTTKHMQWTTHVVAVENIDRFLCAFKGFFTNLNARENYMSTRCKCKASRTSINTMALLTMWTCNLTDSCSPWQMVDQYCFRDFPQRRDLAVENIVPYNRPVSHSQDLHWFLK